MKQQIEQKIPKEITFSKSFEFVGVSIVADFSDTNEGFAFRLRTFNSDTEGKWIWHYESFAELQINERQFRMCSQYWDGTFIAEVPFEITQPK